MSTQEHKKVAIDLTLLLPSALVILCISIPLLVNPEAAKIVVNQLLLWCTGNFGWLYLLAGISSFLFVIWLAFGPVGRIKLGNP